MVKLQDCSEGSVHKPPREGFQPSGLVYKRHSKLSLIQSHTFKTSFLLAWQAGSPAPPAAGGRLGRAGLEGRSQAQAQGVPAVL